MSDRDQNHEDDLILGLVEAIDDLGDSDARVHNEDTARLAREYREVLGLLPYELSGVPVPGQLKERILVAARGEVGPRTLSAPLAARQPAAPRRGWLLPLAASVAVAMMAVTGWLVVQVRSQQVRIAELSQALDRAQSTTVALANSQGMLAELRSRLALVGTPGTQFCALRPPEGSDAAQAVGVVVMHPIREEWFLRIEGLKPCSQGRRYMVWFATDGGAEPGPLFAVKSPGEPVELTVSGRPEKINAIMITLEADPAPTQPSMEPLLFGDERMQVL